MEGGGLHPPPPSSEWEDGGWVADLTAASLLQFNEFNGRFYTTPHHTYKKTIEIRTPHPRTKHRPSSGFFPHFVLHSFDFAGCRAHLAPPKRGHDPRAKDVIAIFPRELLALLGLALRCQVRPRWS